MPPKKKAPTAAQRDPCCVCCQPITKGKEDALFCIGDCQQWLHRYCAGVSTQCYRNFTGDSTPFLCFACSLVRHKKEIDSLKEAVEVLKGEIATLKSSQSSQALPPPSPALLPGVSPTDPQPGGTIAKTVNTTAPAFVSGSHDRKFNVVIYGVEECPSGTRKASRLKDDMDKVVTALSKVDNSIESRSLRDAYRLGRFSTDKKQPRPLLVKFIRAADASSVLSNRDSLRNTTIFIKPDMSPIERKSESILLKERWSLIQSGVPRDVIRIRGSHLLVRNKTHGQVKITGSTLQYCVSSDSYKSVVHNSSSLVSSQSPTKSPPHTDNSPVDHNNPSHSNINSQSHLPAPTPQSAQISASEQ